MTSTPPTKARTKGLGRSFAAKRPVSWSPRQNRMLATAQPMASRITSTMVEASGPGFATVNLVGGTPMSRLTK